MLRTSTTLKLIGGWVVFKSILLGVLWILAFLGQSPFVNGRVMPAPTVTPTPDDSITRPTSEPYTGDLARFDRENRKQRLQIERVLEILRIGPGSGVADIGAGGGWFSAIAAKTVGDHGRVFAVDISEASIKYLNNRIKKEKLDNVVAVLGAPNSPNLPDEAVDAVLILNTYHEIAKPVELLRNLRKSLKRGALVGIIDRDGKGDDHGVDPDEVKSEASRAGYRFVAVYDFVRADRMDYFLVFSVSPEASRE